MVTRARIYEKQVELTSARIEEPVDWKKVRQLEIELRALHQKDLSNDVEMLTKHYMETMQQGGKTELQSIGRLLRKKQIKLEGVL